MKTFKSIFQLLAFSIFVFCFASIADAQSTRTWVSGVGDDVNPCSRTAPCKTFAGAISKTATNGEINCLDPGGYGINTFIIGGTVNLTVSNSRFAANNVGFNLANNTKAAIQNSTISGNTLNGLAAFQADLNVTNCVVMNNGTGILSQSGGTIRLTGSTVTGNTTGLNASAGSIVSYSSNMLNGNVSDGTPTSTVVLQ